MDSTLQAFQKVDIRAGTIVSAEEFPEAKQPAYKIWVDLGPDIGVKKTSAGITTKYRISDLPGQQVICVVNFPVMQIGPFMSELLILGLENEDGDVVLATPHSKVPNGARLH